MLAQAPHTVQFTISSDCAGRGSVIHIGARVPHLYGPTYLSGMWALTCPRKKQYLPCQLICLSKSVILSVLFAASHHPVQCSAHGGRQWADKIITIDRLGGEAWSVPWGSLLCYGKPELVHRANLGGSTPQCLHSSCLVSSDNLGYSRKSHSRVLPSYRHKRGPGW